MVSTASTHMVSICYYKCALLRPPHLSLIYPPSLSFHPAIGKVYKEGIPPVPRDRAMASEYSEKAAILSSFPKPGRLAVLGGTFYS